MTPFGMKASEAGRAADVFALAQATANLNVEQLGETMKYAAPVAATFGLNLEETSVIAQIFANNGIKASMAGTALRAGLSRLAAPPKEAAKSLSALN
ncbi:phage tail tape measure protein, partial [Bacillus cereus]|nr:phage tail tape measure protein [Bacillus cereus]